MEESVQTAQSDVSIYLQRRADLIPNFVKSVQGYSDYEQSTYTAVTEARAAVSKAGSVEEQAEASTQLDKAIDIWVNAVTEAYPELKANEQYIALQDELAGSENRIATARNDYNAVAQKYNTAIRKFPANIVAGIFGFDKADYFESDANANNVPTVDFS
jgi:LemA protein